MQLVARVGRLPDDESSIRLCGLGYSDETLEPTPRWSIFEGYYHIANGIELVIFNVDVASFDDTKRVGSLAPAIIIPSSASE